MRATRTRAWPPASRSLDGAACASPHERLQAPACVSRRRTRARPGPRCSPHRGSAGVRRRRFVKKSTQRGTRRGARPAYAPRAYAGAQHSQASHSQPSRICGGAPVQPPLCEKIVGKHGLYRCGPRRGPAGRPRRRRLVAAENWPGRTARMRRSGRGAPAAASRRQRNRRAWKRRRSCRSRSSAST